MAFLEHNVNSVVFMTAPNIMAPHAFTTRYGGVSRGVFESLNLGANLSDDPLCVKENYRRICDVIGIQVEDLVCTSQVHGCNVRTVSFADRGNLFKPGTSQADGLITSDGGVALLVFTADCVPVLLHDPVSGATGAVHAGWRGTAANIVGAAVTRMSEDFGCIPDDIRASIGPCISKCCYETDRDVPDALRNVLGDDADICIEPRGCKFMVDLKNANRILLVRAGLHDITVSDECTSCFHDKYWSHRFSLGMRGSQAAIIAPARQDRKGSIA